MARRDFYAWEDLRPEFTVDGQRLLLPLCYHRNEVFASFHTADFHTVKALLPSDLLHPVRWADGRAVLTVIAFRCSEITATAAEGFTRRLRPFGEIAVGALVTAGPAARVAPMLRSRKSAFLLHLPVTTREARDIGPQWGFPTFVADMDFLDDPATRAVELSEGGKRILGLTVRPGGPVLPDHGPMVAYAVREGELIETEIPVHGHAQLRLGKGSGSLVLGEHPVGRQLAMLGLSSEAVGAMSYLDHRSIVPAGSAIGTAREYRGHTGADRELGRYTVAYPTTAPLDQYAPLERPADVPH